jgi:antirestriction protein ArdC
MSHYTYKSDEDEFIRLADALRKALHRTQERHMLTKELYAATTAKVVAEIEEGVVPWAKPWETAIASLPSNAVTRRPYSGINTLLLWLSMQERGYPSHGWLTFKQAQELKASVRKGEKATSIAFVKYVDDEETENKKRPVLKTYFVFNVAQLDNMPAAYGEPPTPSDDERYNAAVKFSDHCGVKVDFGSFRAAYLPHMDVVHMPPPDSFQDQQAFFGTLFHELIHSTGHKSRMDRQYGKRFGDDAYAFEELVAELGSAFLCAKYGYPAEHRSAAYVDGWLKIMKGDQRAIFSAASYASQAADYLVAEAEKSLGVTTEVTSDKSNELEDSIAY